MLRDIPRYSQIDSTMPLTLVPDSMDYHRSMQWQTVSIARQLNRFDVHRCPVTAQHVFVRH